MSLSFLAANTLIFLHFSRLHDYQPHGGAAVSRIMFCDNHISQDPE